MHTLHRDDQILRNMATRLVLFDGVVSSWPAFINLWSIDTISRYCNQSIVVRVVIDGFRSSKFPLMLTRTPAEQTFSTDNIDSIALSYRYFAYVMPDETSTVPCFRWSVSTSGNQLKKTNGTLAEMSIMSLVVVLYSIAYHGHEAPPMRV